MQSRYISLILGISLFLMANAALSYTRTIQGRIYFEDDRVHTSSAYGSKLDGPASQRQLRFAKYQVFGICGRTTYTGAQKYASAWGVYSQTFNTWCSDPEFQILVTLESKIDGRVYHRVLNYNDNENTFSFRIRDAGRDLWFQPGYSTGSNETKWQSVNISCPDDYHHYCASPTNLSAHESANVYATGADVGNFAGHYSGHTNATLFNIVFPHPNANQADGYDRVLTRDDLWGHNHRIAHEYGHLYMKRAIGINAGCPSAYTISPPQGPHHWDYATDDTAKSETLATSEGQANFFAIATYFHPYASEPYYRWCDGLSGCQDGDTYTSADLARAEGLTQKHYQVGASGLSVCAGGNTSSSQPIHQNEGNATRFFWDIYDTTTLNDNGQDSLSLDLDEMLEIWEAFRGHNGENEFGNRGYLEPKN